MRTSVYRWLETHPAAGDSVLGVLLLTILSVESTELRYSDPRQVPFLIVCAAPVFLRRTHTRTALLLAIALLATNLLVVDRATFAVVLAPVMVHAAVAHLPTRAGGWVALAAGLIGSLLAPTRWGYSAQSDSTVYAMAVGLCAVSVVAAYVIGERQRDRADNQAEQFRVMAERAVIVAAERDQRVRVAAADERARIARELHDIVAHSLSVVIVQADGAAAVVATRPELAPTVLRTIAETGREALAEMRLLVGVLRTGPAEPEDYAPAQRIADLPALIDQMRRTGMAVELVTTGTASTVGAGLDLTVYRLVQEALTNVLKHAGPGARATVAIDHGSTSLSVSVTDDGRGSAARPADGQEPAPGHGLLGMRERVLLQGGRLTAGYRTGGGFGVRADFPVPPRPDARPPSHDAVVDRR